MVDAGRETGGDGRTTAENNAFFGDVGEVCNPLQGTCFVLFGNEMKFDDRCGAEGVELGSRSNDVAKRDVDAVCLGTCEIDIVRGRTRDTEAEDAFPMDILLYVCTSFGVSLSGCVVL